MTELQRTFRLLWDAYPAYVVGCRSGVYTFRTRVSDDLHLAFGIPIDSRRASGFPWHEYRFGCPRDEALRLYRKGRRKAPDREEGKKALLDTQCLVKGLQQDNRGPSGKDYDPHKTGKEGGIKSGEVRRAKAKGVKIGGRIMAWSVYRKQLEDQKQGSLL
jgi:hypothetical protein